MKDRDPLGYYATLGIEPDASHEDVRRAYASLRMEALTNDLSVDIDAARHAYQTLVDEATRATYDGRDKIKLIRWKDWAWQQYMLVTGVLGVVVLIAMLTLTNGFSSVRAAFTHFDPGSVIYRLETRRVLGTVLAYDKRHEFPNGVVKSAYEIRLESDESTRWFPASEIDSLFARVEASAATFP